MNVSLTFYPLIIVIWRGEVKSFAEKGLTDSLVLRKKVHRVGEFLPTVGDVGGTRRGSSSTTFRKVLNLCKSSSHLILKTWREGYNMLYANNLKPRKKLANARCSTTGTYHRNGRTQPLWFRRKIPECRQLVLQQSQRGICAFRWTDRCTAHEEIEDKMPHKWSVAQCRRIIRNVQATHDQDWGNPMEDRADSGGNESGDERKKRRYGPMSPLCFPHQRTAGKDNGRRFCAQT